MEWLTQLKEKERRGSRPRCLALLESSNLAQTLTDLIGKSSVSFEPTHERWPKGIPRYHNGQWDVSRCKESRLAAGDGILAPDLATNLRQWWLAEGMRGNTPNWDIVSQCLVAGKRGIALFEAKAHSSELSDSGKGSRNDSGGNPANHERIKDAIAEASEGLRQSTGWVWALHRDKNYQVSNRFAWAWRIATSGVPVVLVYLGFLNADEMVHNGSIFKSHADWEACVLEHCKGTIPEAAWTSEIRTNGVSINSLILSKEVSLKG